MLLASLAQIDTTEKNAQILLNPACFLTLLIRNKPTETSVLSLSKYTLKRKENRDTLFDISVVW